MYPVQGIKLTTFLYHQTGSAISWFDVMDLYGASNLARNLNVLSSTAVLTHYEELDGVNS